jgi:hypothetical protein
VRRRRRRTCSSLLYRSATPATQIKPGGAPLHLNRGRSLHPGEGKQTRGRGGARRQRAPRPRRRGSAGASELDARRPVSASPRAHPLRRTSAARAAPLRHASPGKKARGSGSPAAGASPLRRASRGKKAPVVRRGSPASGSARAHALETGGGEGEGRRGGALR